MISGRKGNVILPAAVTDAAPGAAVPALWYPERVNC